MKKYLRLFFINLFSLWLAVQVLSGVSFTDGFQTLAKAAVALTIINFIIRPLIKILLLPINLLTLGAFRWLVNVISLYLVTIIVPQFNINSFYFSGFNYQGFTVPAVQLTAFWGLVVTSFLISLTATFLLWLAKK